MAGLTNLQSHALKQESDFQRCVCMHVYDEARLQGCSDFYSLACKKDAVAFLMRDMLLYF